MRDINKLKNRARREEQRENWSAAIDLYTRALRATERDSAGDLSLYNRIGDIHLRLGNVEQAVELYEEAIERYATEDLHTSAIALCNKVLRIMPDRHQVHLQLGRLHLATGLLAEARVAHLRYAEAMRTAGHVDEAVAALRGFVERTADTDVGIRAADWLVEKGRSAEAHEFLEELRTSLEETGADAGPLVRRIEEISSEGGTAVAGGAAAAEPARDPEPGEPAVEEAEEPPAPEAGAELFESIAGLEAELEAAVAEKATTGEIAETPRAAGDDEAEPGSPEEAIEPEGPEGVEEAAEAEEPAAVEGRALWEAEEPAGEEWLSEIGEPTGPEWLSEAEEPGGAEESVGKPRTGFILETPEGPSRSPAAPPEAEEAVLPAAFAAPPAWSERPEERERLERPGTSGCEREAASAPEAEGAEAPVVVTAGWRVAFLPEAREPGSDPSSGEALANVTLDRALASEEREPWDDAEPEPPPPAACGREPGEGPTPGMPGGGLPPRLFRDPPDGASPPVRRPIHGPAVERPEPPARPGAGAGFPGGPMAAAGGGARESAEPGSHGHTFGLDRVRLAEPREDPAGAEPLADALGPIGTGDPERGGSGTGAAATEGEGSRSDPFLAHYHRGLELRTRGDLDGAIREFERATQSPTCFLQAYRALEECLDLRERTSPRGGRGHGGRTARTAAEGEEEDRPVVPWGGPSGVPPSEEGPEAGDAEIGVEGPPPAEPVPEEEPEAVAAGAPPEEGFRQWLEAASEDVLERALAELERREEVSKAAQVVERLLRLRPSDPGLHERRVAFLTESGEREAALAARLQLGAALEMAGRREEAREAYAAVLDLDPGNRDAGAAIAAVDREERAEEERARETRAQEEAGSRPGLASPMEVELARASAGGRREPEPSGMLAYEGLGEREGTMDFEVILAELKERLAEGEAETDAGSRTEVGERLKDMGLLDDAIRELQVAVRDPGAPPRAYELLGEAFIEKGRPRVAARLLADALERLGSLDDDELLGVLYQLGVAYERVGEETRALECYERIFSVDIDYRDVQKRIGSCSV